MPVLTPDLTLPRLADTMTAIPSETRDEFEKLERKHAENPEGRYFVPLANAFRKVGEVDRAMTMLRDGLAKHPDYLSAHIVLGRCLADTGELGQAEAEFRHVLSLDPQNLIALRTLGELAAAAGKSDEARTWFRDLLSVDPMNEEARRALESLQVPPAAAHDATSSVAPEYGGSAEPAGLQPATAAPDETAGHPEATPATDYDALFGSMLGLGQAQQLENADGALAEESNAVVTETIAELYTRQGFYDRAAEVYRELIRRHGDDPRLQERLERVQSLAAADLGPPSPSLTGLEGSEGPRALDLEDRTTEALDSLEGSSVPEEAEAEEWRAGSPGVPAGLGEGDDREGAPAVTIRSHLREVVSWVPRPPSEPEDWARGEQPGAGEAEPPEAREAPGGAEASIEDPTWAQAAEVQDLPAEDDRLDDLFPWELPESYASGETPSERPDPETGSVTHESDSPLPADDGSAGTAEGGESAVSPGGPAPPEQVPHDDDDDLESFQEWLRSLKR